MRLPSTEYRERIEAYMLKASREAKTRTSWSDVSAGYEEALTQFIRSILEPREGNLFFAELQDAQRLISRFGLLNSLSQTLIKLTVPGVPDIYQGNELWDLSLVDPDNRRPVDYELRRGMLVGAARRAPDRWHRHGSREAVSHLENAPVPTRERDSVSRRLSTGAGHRRACFAYLRVRPTGRFTIRSDDRATAVFATAGKS